MKKFGTSGTLKSVRKRRRGGLRRGRKKTEKKKTRMTASKKARGTGGHDGWERKQFQVCFQSSNKVGETKGGGKKKWTD